MRAQILLESSDVAEFVEEDEARARRDIAAAKVLIDQDPGAPADMRRSYYNLLSIIERWSDHWPEAKAAAERAVALIPNSETLAPLLGISDCSLFLTDENGQVILRRLTTTGLLEVALIVSIESRIAPVLA